MCKEHTTQNTVMSRIREATWGGMGGGKDCKNSKAQQLE